MKRLISLLMSIMLLLSLTACGGTFAQVDLQDTMLIPENGIIEKKVIKEISEAPTVSYLVEKEEDREKRRTGKDKYFDRRARRLEVDSKVLFVSTQWSEFLLSEFIKQVNAKNWGIEIKKEEIGLVN